MDEHDLEALSGLNNYVRWIVSHFVPYIGGKVVEYGAGLGSISKHIFPMARTIDFVEPSPALFIQLRNKFGNVPHATCHATTLGEHAAASQDDTYDSVVLVNVLEHIEDDRAALRDVHRILRPGGSICLMVPALPWLMSPYDVQMGHCRRYRLGELSEVVLGAGFVIEKARYMDVFGVMPWWFFMCMLKQQHIRGWMAKVFDIVVVPIGRVVEALLRPPFGKNLVMVATKSSPSPAQRPTQP